MITREQDILKRIIGDLQEYEIKNDDDFTDYLYEVIDGMIDIYTSDLLESIEFLYRECDFTEVHGDLIEAIQQAQYDYYNMIADDNMGEIYESVEKLEVTKRFEEGNNE